MKSERARGGVMNKIKGLLLLFLGVLLTYLAWENVEPATLKAFGRDLGRPPLFSLAYGGVALGFVAGWLTHALRLRRRKRAADQAASTQEKQQAQQP